MKELKKSGENIRFDFKNINFRFYKNFLIKSEKIFSYL
ncbi:hypothetical protein LEP1GSC170_5469 [Leptospira interrogans serovar Bataviae str. HAI135]|nr:hypothetical protein LEP1GSC170_5469 [Leptospira interrogans serovar Bataviae str. HAI135]